LAALLGEYHLPASYDTLSEPEVLRLLHLVHVRVNQAKTRGTVSPLASAQSWLAQTREDLERFRVCRDEMVRRNLRFVVMLARRYQSNGVGRLDLVQEGALGLMRAVEKFDPERGVPFASYAVWWIREAFSRALASWKDNTCSSDSPHGEQEEDSLADRVAAPEEASPEIVVLTADAAKSLHRALTSLPVQEAEIVRLRFGLGDGRARTLEEVSQRLKLSREQVRLREQRALVRLRTFMQQPPKITEHNAQAPRRPWRNAA
jgi:RNA polymerase sigma factor (sigma-70 family)